MDGIAICSGRECTRWLARDEVRVPSARAMVAPWRHGPARRCGVATRLREGPNSAECHDRRARVARCRLALQAIRALHCSPSIRCGLHRRAAVAVRRTPRATQASALARRVSRTDRMRGGSARLPVSRSNNHRMSSSTVFAWLEGEAFQRTPYRSRNRQYTMSRRAACSVKRSSLSPRCCQRIRRKCVTSSRCLFRHRRGGMSGTVSGSGVDRGRRLSLTALMEPPMSGSMEPLTGADLGSRTG